MGGPTVVRCLNSTILETTTLTSLCLSDPNKSNSSINPKLKERLVPLIKKTLNTDFSTNPRVMITPTLKHQVWEAVAGNVCRSTCTSPDCSKEMTAWKYDVMRLNPARDNVLENLTPICKECSRTLD